MTLSDILKEKQFNENEQRKEKLIELIASNEAFLIVGAGSSKLQGCPLWRELLKLYEQHIEEEDVAADVIESERFRFRDNEHPESDMQYASRLQTRLTRQRFRTILDQILNKDFGCSQAHIAMVTLPFRGIFTTNYDLILEAAVAQAYPGAYGIEVILDEDHKREVFNYLRSVSSNGKKFKRIVHLHGHIQHLNTIVLCEEEYQEKYGFSFTTSEDGRTKNIKDHSWTLHRKLMWNLIATRRLVYSGFSMADEYFQLMHELVGDDLSTYGDDTHYLIERISTSDSKEYIEWKLKQALILKRKYSIETVFYFDDGAENNLSSFMLELRNRVNNGRTSQLTSESPVTKASTIISSREIYKKLLDLSKQQLENED